MNRRLRPIILAISNREEVAMFDLVMIAIGVAGFVAFLGYVTLCERM